MTRGGQTRRTERRWLPTTTIGAAAIGLASAAVILIAGADADPRDNEVLAIDIDAHADTLDLLVAERRLDEVALVHRRSRDGGATWSEPVPVDRGGRGVASPHRGNDPQVATAGDALLVLWTTPGPSPWGSGPLAAAVSLDGGRTWTAGPAPGAGETAGGQGFTDVAIDPEGRAYVAWLDDRTGARGLRLATAEAPYRAWRETRTADAETCACCWNRLLAIDAGRAFVLYRDAAPRDMAVALTEDAGRTWRRAGAAGAFGWRFDGCPHVGGGLALTRAAGLERLHALVWTGLDGRMGTYVVSSDDGGSHWSPPRRLGGRGARRGDVAAWAGTLAAVWEEAEAVFAARSPDAGRTWSAPRRLSAPGAAAAYPRIAATADGFFVVWTEEAGDQPAAWTGVTLPQMPGS